MDFLLSFPSTPTSEDEGLPLPSVTLLEFNASPDFVQSGDRLRPRLAEMFKGVVHIAIAPFFGLSTRSAEGDEEEVAGENDEGIIGEGGAVEIGMSSEVMGWVKIGEGQVRGPTA